VDDFQGFALPCVGRIEDCRNDHAGEAQATVSPDGGGLNFLAFDRVVQVPALEPGPAALAEGILQESVECSGGGRLRDVAGQMVFDPAVITARPERTCGGPWPVKPNASNRRLNSVAPGLAGGRPWLPRDIFRDVAGCVQHDRARSVVCRRGPQRQFEGERRSALATHRSGDVASTGFKPSVSKAPAALAPDRPP
jgi:hypothetical protein